MLVDSCFFPGLDSFTKSENFTDVLIILIGWEIRVEACLQRTKRVFAWCFHFTGICEWPQGLQTGCSSWNKGISTPWINRFLKFLSFCFHSQVVPQCGSIAFEPMEEFLSERDTIQVIRKLLRCTSVLEFYIILQQGILRALQFQIKLAVRGRGRAKLTILS